MGSLTAQAIYQLAAEILEDTHHVTYLEAQLMTLLNEGQRAICLMRPDAKVVIENFELTANAVRHTLDGDSRRLGGVIRNMGADGDTPGKAITGPVPRESMDAVDPDWPTATGPHVKQFIYDEDAPTYFYIYPTVASTWFVEAKLFKDPADITAKADRIDIGDIYAPPLREWLLYAAFARDSERTPNWIRAGRHLANFYQLLGIKTRADLAVSPKFGEYGKQLAAAGMTA